MAADACYGSASSTSFDLNVIFRDDIGEILAKMDSKLASDVVDEMSEAYDMSTLLNIRIKMFRFAKKKLFESVSVPGIKDMDPVFDKSVSHGCAEDAQRMMDEWALIARKGKPRVAMDTIDLLSYVSGECPYFPYKIIKKNPKRGKNGERGRRNKTGKTGKSQALIPFTSVATTGPSAQKAGDNESVTSDAPASEFDTYDNDSQTDMSDYETSNISDNGQPNDIADPCITSGEIEHIELNPCVVPVLNVQVTPPTVPPVTTPSNSQGVSHDKGHARPDPPQPDTHDTPAEPENLHDTPASLSVDPERPAQASKDSQSEPYQPPPQVSSTAPSTSQKA